MIPADRLLRALDTASLTELPSGQQAGFDLPAAFALAEQLRQLRLARGEKPLGYKIGFTNRSIWQRYGVHAPIWGPVWDSTVQCLPGVVATASLSRLSQPRLEPEVVFAFASPPRPGMNLDQLRGCIDWVAHGFEIVHTHFENWQFQAADTVADFALHGRLLIGPRIGAAQWPSVAEDTAAMQVELLCDERVVDRGVGKVVLDGPLNALRLWVDAMAQHSPLWRIDGGDVVTTGTITDAWPLKPGQRWSTRLSEHRLSALTLLTTD